MRTLIEQLAEKMRNPVGIAFHLVKLGYFEKTDAGLDAALAVVDRVLGAVPNRRN